MQAKIDLNKLQFDQLEAFLKKGIQEPAQKVVKRVSGYAENRIGLNAKEIVYSYIPKTRKYTVYKKGKKKGAVKGKINTTGEYEYTGDQARYTRTGRLLGGRGSSLSGGKPARTDIDKLTVRFEANPQLKGAKINYATYVNYGTKRMPARPFFTKSTEDTEKETSKIVGEILDKFLSDNIFKV